MEINKCAKCGGEAEHIKLFDSKRSECFFRCTSCGRETKVYASKQNAIEAWNSGKLTLTDKDMIELLRGRALAGRMSVQDKQVMLEAADRIESLADDKDRYARKIEELTDSANEFIQEGVRLKDAYQLKHDKPKNK